MELTNEVYNAVNKYFSVLSHIGYKSYSQVDQLLIALFIEEILYGPMSQYVTEEDYNTINNSLYCLYGSCMLPFPDYKRAYDETVTGLPDEYRITESGVLRSAETSELRTKS